MANGRDIGLIAFEFHIIIVFQLTASTARFRFFPPTAGLVGRVLRTGFGRCKRRPAGIFLEKFPSRDFGGRFGGVRARPSG